MKSNDKKKNPKTAQILFTALLLLVCAAVYLFTETGYNKEIEESESTEEIIESGVFKEKFCENAFKGLSYTEGSKNSYSINSDVFEEPPLVVLSERAGFIKAFTLSIEEPVFTAEDDAANPIEARLFQERKLANEKRRAWLDNTLQSMILALDIEERLTNADIQYILHIADTVVDDGKQQSLMISDYNVRIYLDDGPRLTVSVQDEKTETEE